MLLLDGQTEALTQAAINKALEGDTTAIRLCLERIAPAPKDTAIQFDLPQMQSAYDASKAAHAVLRAVSDGDLTPSEGAHVMALVETYRKTLETVDLERRINELEGARQ